MSVFDEGPRREALRMMFRDDPDGAHRTLNSYLDEFPKDALAHSLNAAVTFYHYVANRMPEGPRETLAMVLLGKGIKFPAGLKKELQADLGRARAYADDQCAGDLLALAIVESIKRDYLAMVSQKWRASLECARLAHAYALRLLKMDPSAEDACFVLAITEYMIHRIPLLLHPFTSINGVRGDRRKAIEYCRRVIKGGHYFEEFARRLLVDLYLDEGKRGQAVEELNILALQFPENAGIMKDLKKLSAST
jgi:hypothetical protein